MIGFATNEISSNPLDYDYVEIVSQNNTDDIWLTSNGKTYKYIIPYRFFNPDNMRETIRYIFLLINGKPKLYLL